MIRFISFNLLILPSAKPFDKWGNFSVFRMAALSLKNPRIKAFKCLLSNCWTLVIQISNAEALVVLRIDLNWWTAGFTYQWNEILRSKSKHLFVLSIEMFVMAD